MHQKSFTCVKMGPLNVHSSACRWKRGMVVGVMSQFALCDLFSSLPNVLVVTTQKFHSLPFGLYYENWQWQRAAGFQVHFLPPNAGKLALRYISSRSSVFVCRQKLVGCSASVLCHFQTEAPNILWKGGKVLTFWPFHLEMKKFGLLQFHSSMSDPNMLLWWLG